MSRRAALLAGSAIAAPVVWTVAASAAAIWWMGLWNAFPYPSIQWFSYLPYRDRDPLIGKALTLGAVAGTAALAAAGSLLKGAFSPAPSLHGKSAFATRGEAKKAGIVYSRRPRGDSILLGRTQGFLGIGRRYLNLPGTDHAALYARTGAGKGVSFVVPACLAWQGSLVAFDIKGELHRITAGHRRAMGQDVFFFAPTAHDGRSHRYNPFDVVPRGSDRCVDAIQKRMHLLVPPNPKSENPFWINAARALGAAGAVMLAETPGEALNPAAVLRMFTRPDHKEVIHGLVKRARKSGKPLPRVAVDTALSWCDSEDAKTREGVVEELKSHFSIYASPQIAAATEASDFDFRDLRTRGISVYIGLTPDELRRLRPLMAVMFQDIVGSNTQVEFGHDPTHTHRVLMMLDEFWAPGRMDMLADAAAFVRSYGIRMAYVVQTKAQLVSIYGQEGSENLFQNTGAEVAFGASDMKLCKELSERAGFDTREERTKSRPVLGGLDITKISESIAARRRALLLPQEIARLPADEQLVYRPGMPVLRTHRIRWFTDRLLKRLAAPPPPVPELAVTVERDNGAPLASAPKQPAWSNLP